MSPANNTPSNTLLIDGAEVPFVKGQSILQAALSAGKYIFPIFAITRNSSRTVPASCAQ